MRILVTGATGVMGGSAITQLVQAGHEVKGVVRAEGTSDVRDAKFAIVRALGADPVVADLFDAGSVREVVRGSDVVCHLATNVPPLRRAVRKSAWSTHNRLRTEATRLLVDAARDAGAHTFVKESIVFVYPDRGNAWIDETTPIAPTPMMNPTVRGEELASGFGGDGRRAVVLRFGLFYGAQATSTDEALRMARFGFAALPGAREAFVSSIHLDDVGRSIRAALEAPDGVYNVVDDEPLTRRSYADAFATAFGLRHLRLAPRWPLRLAAGADAGVLLASRRVANRRFREATGWEPQHTSARTGWSDVAATRSREEAHHA